MQAQASVKDLMDRDVTDQAGHKIGTVRQVYLNDVSGEPEWVRVHTGLFGNKECFVPLADARHAGDALTIPYDKDKVKHAPQIDADQHLSREQVADLYRYYGLRAPQQREGVPGQAGTAREGGTRQAQQARGREQVPGQARDEGMGDRARRDQLAREEMAGRERRARAESARTQGRGLEDGMVELTLSEERLRVGTERHEAERVRLHKRVEIEHVERTVPVYREELRIEREPIADGEAAGASGRFQIGEDEREIVLYEERPVVAKETVPVERIRVRAERVASEQTVRDEIRKERIDVSHTGADMSRSGQTGGRPGREGAQNPQRPGRHERR